MRLNCKLLLCCQIIFLVIGISSCRKPALITNVVILGPTTVCYGETDVIFSVAPNPHPSHYILWTVPEQAQIISGQGTETIKVNFGRNAGQVGITYFSRGEEISEASFLDVKFDVQNKWCRLIDFKGEKRSSGVGFSIGNKGYVGLGFAGNTTSRLKDFWEYDPVLSAWTQKDDFDGPGRAAAVGFSIGSKGYVGTGESGTGGYLKDFWEYDPVLNQWMLKDSVLGEGRQYAMAFSIGNKGYIGSGQTAPLGILTYARDFYEYDPSAAITWVKKDSLPKSFLASVGFSIGNKGYCLTGIYENMYSNDFFEFDRDDASKGFDTNNNPLGKWTQKDNFPGAQRAQAIGFSIGNRGYVGTGVDNTIYFNDFWEYDPNTGWLQKPDIGGEGRGYAVGFSIGNKGYVGTGAINPANFDNSKEFWVYSQ